MRFPCESVVKNFLTAYRHGLIIKLTSKRWTQQKIAEALNITQAAVSGYIKKSNKEYGDETFSTIVQGAIDASLPKLELDIVRVSDVVDVVCTTCKTARLPGDKFCSLHVNEIPALGAESCHVCSKYVNASLLVRGSEEQDIINDLISGYNKIRYNTKFISLIPEVQSNLVLGFKDETKNDLGDYAGFPGRIIKTGSEAKVVDLPAFGASKHISRILSIIRKRLPTVRAATCITFNQAIRASMSMTGFSFVSLDNERDDVVLQESIKKNVVQGIDALVFEGSIGMEPLTYVLGTSIEDVIDKLVKILSYL